MKDLKDVRDRMIEIVGQPEKLGFINARLVLRTGITLTGPGDAVTADELNRVVTALKEMGYVLDARRERV